MIKFIIAAISTLIVCYFIYLETGITTAIVLFLLIINTIRKLDILKVHGIVLQELSNSISELTKNKG